MKIPASFAIATAEESQKIDEKTVQSFGIDEFTLMEVAGLSAAKEILQSIQPGDYGVFLCGKGNNGGDALVVARYLLQQGIVCTVVFAGGSNGLSPTAKKNFDLLRKINENASTATVKFCHSWADFEDKNRPDFIIDGMLGTGLNSDLRGDYPAAVTWANKSEAPIFAMDIPTGLHADSGAIMGEAIRATTTFAFGILKQGFYLQSGHEYTGTIHYCELPFPDFTKKSCSAYLIDRAWISERPNDPARHKYEAGVVYIIAGSEGLTGAAIMAAKSAWSEGAGAVIVVSPRGLLPAFEYNLPQIIKKPVGNRDDLFFKENHLDEVHAVVQEKPGVVLVGPGMGRQSTTVNFVTQFLAKNTQNCIIDADALWALSQQDHWEKPESSEWILTPHPGELTTLMNRDFENDFERLSHVKVFARKKQVVLLSKGFPVIIGTSQERAYLSGYDTRIFSRAGFGDILAGKIASFRALGHPAEESCCRALLSGKHKVDQLRQNNPHYTPEPLDLI